MEKWDFCILGQGHHEGLKCQWMFVWMIFSDSQNILLPNLVWWCSIMSQSNADVFFLFLLSSWSRSQLGLIWSRYDNVYCIFWTADPKPKCCMEKMDCCVKGQGHSKISKCQEMFVQMISSEMLNFLPPNLVWWCIIDSIWLSQIVFQKDWFAVFEVKVTVKNNITKIWLLNILSELLILFQVDLVWWHIIVRWFVLWKDGIALLWSRSWSQKRLRIPVNVHLNNISSAAEPSVNTWYCDAKSWAKVSCKMICFLSSSSGSAWGLIWSEMTVLPYLLNCWSFCNKIWMIHYKLECSV